MSDNTENTETAYSHVDLPPVYTAGALPSSRTESMLQSALDAIDKDEKDSHLKHIWSHYQSLEFALANWEYNAQILADAADEVGISREQYAEFATKFFLMAVLENAYETAHQTGLYVALGFAENVPDALRKLYPSLDHTDPEREADEAIAVDTVDPEDAEDRKDPEDRRTQGDF